MIILVRRKVGDSPEFSDYRDMCYYDTGDGVVRHSTGFRAGFENIRKFMFEYDHRIYERCVYDGEDE